LLYANPTTAVRIHFEVREAWMLVSFYPIEDGKVTEAAQEGSRRGYALPHIAALEAPDLVFESMYTRKPRFSDPDRELDDYIDFHAKCVRRFADDFVRGDFTRGPQVEAVAARWLKLRMDDLERPLGNVPQAATAARPPRKKTTADAASKRAPSRRRKS
jgi:hypothetical protein